VFFLFGCFPILGPPSNYGVGEIYSFQKPKFFFLGGGGGGVGMALKCVALVECFQIVSTLQSTSMGKFIPCKERNLSSVSLLPGFRKCVAFIGSSPDIGLFPLVKSVFEEEE